MNKLEETNLTVDEVIKYCEAVAKEQKELYMICPASESEFFNCDGTKDCRVLINGKDKGCLKCAEKYSQIVKWLKEREDYRMAIMQIIDKHKEIGGEI